MKIAAAVLAAGSGRRFGADKVRLTLGGIPVWRWSFDVLASHPRVDQVFLVGPDGTVPGGETRPDSVRAALGHTDADILLLHDGARPGLSHDVITRVIEAIERVGAAGAAIPAVDTLRNDGGDILPRDGVVMMQTPQGGRVDWLREAYATTDDFTDDLAYLRAAGHPFEVVLGDPRNFKLTYPDDLQRAESLLLSPEFRTGLGYDVHRFSTDPGRELWLGGVLFDHKPGLDGHSDADVILHAVTDAILGGASAGDIGVHFPPSDPKWKGQRSSLFLKEAVRIAGEKGWRVRHLDIAVQAEHPRIMPHAAEIRAVIAEATGLGEDDVSIKATTQEGLGAIGRGEGIAAFATATLCRFRRP
jgi:2-C-methyl-D-erythritol 4-phosphate cytidylyltransferase/2-C-methyl-D-erythritol 2,4-cyclodiphosphate synthase